MVGKKKKTILLIQSRTIIEFLSTTTEAIFELEGHNVRLYLTYIKSPMISHRELKYTSPPCDSVYLCPFVHGSVPHMTLRSTLVLLLLPPSFPPSPLI